MEEKILNINEYPVIRAYTYHAYPLSILSSNNYVGEKKVELFIEGDTSNISVETFNARYDISNNVFIMLADEYAEEVKAQLKFADIYPSEREFNINYFQYTQPYAYISLAISDKYDLNEVASVYFYRNGKVDAVGWENIDDIKNVSKQIEKFKLKINENNVAIEIFNDQIQRKILEKQLEKTYLNYNVTITMFLGENQYYNWLYSNYIQLFGRNIFLSDYFLDYYIAPERQNSIMYTIHSLLEYHHIDKQVLARCNINLVEFAKANIEEGNYIEFVLNQRYIAAAGFDDNNFLHQTLIYGYSDIKKIFYIEIISSEGKLKTTTISYNDFYNAVDVNYERIVVIKYDPPQQFYKLSIKNIKESLCDYLYGKNYDEYYKYILQSNFLEGENKCNTNFVEEEQVYLDRYKKVYGHNLFSFFLENQQMFDYLLRDFKIAYVWKEHKEIMVERLKFLQYRKKIDYEKGVELISDAMELKNKADIMLHLCMKYKFFPRKKIANSIRQLLKNIMEDDKKCIQKLLNALQETSGEKAF